MDTDNDHIISKQCFKCDYALLDNLNVVYNSSNSMIILWNKYQIFVYDNFKFESAAKMLVPEFHITCLITLNNYFVCLDICGNIHVTSLKFKNVAKKRLKYCFQPREQNIEKCIQYDQDHILSLKFESCTFFLCLHRINSVFKLEKKTVLINKTEYWPQQHSKEKYVLTSQIVTEQHISYVNNTFHVIENARDDCSIVIISFDKLTVYGCLFSPKMTEDEIVLVKLYSCPAEICNIEIIETNDLNIVIGLTVGSIIKLSLRDLSKCPELIFLNTALYKCLVRDDKLIYTDGVSMWKTENTFSACDIKFNQLFIKHVKDFAKCGDQIVCTSFTNLFYVFPVDDEKSYLIPETVDKYCSAKKLLNNSDYLYKIFEEIETNNELIKKLNQESNHITALSLSNRQDVMDNIINSNVTVYESYKEAIEECPECILTEAVGEYFKAETYFFSLHFTVSAIQQFSSLLSNFGDWKIHITMSSECKILKTTSIKITEKIKKVFLLIPLATNDMLDMSQVNIYIKIVANIPGALDEKQTVWTVLYKKNIVLNSEHFIKTHTVSSKNSNLKESKESLEDLILKMVSNQYGDLFQFTHIHETVAVNWSLFVKLPNNYEELLKTKEYCKQHFNTQKAFFLIQQYSSEDFLKSKSNITFVIGCNKVHVEILNDGISNPILKVTSENIKLASNIRNFFSSMIYKDFVNCAPGKEFVNHTVYTVAENLQKSFKDLITGSAPSEAFPSLVERFQKSIIGALPL